MRKNARQQFDERRTAVAELGLSTRIRPCPTSWSGAEWPRKALIAGLESVCFGMPPDRQRNCHLPFPDEGGRSPEGGGLEVAGRCWTRGEVGAGETARLSEDEPRLSARMGAAFLARPIRHVYPGGFPFRILGESVALVANSSFAHLSLGSSCSRMVGGDQI